MNADSVKPVHTKTGLRADAGFERTTLIIDPGESDQGSIDIVHATEGFLARINIFTDSLGNWFAVDVIDVDDQWKRRKALTFQGGQRASMDAAKTVAADFRDRKVKEA